MNGQPSGTIGFGPVPSRRLGRSLGINNIPPKNCTYSCVYCQVGRTLRNEVERRQFYETEAVMAGVREKLEQSRASGERVDYLTFVPDGEPTLDVNLGREIDALRSSGEKIAVITNSSLLWRDDVRAELGKTDWVSFKVDSVLERVWRRVNRPHRSLSLDAILNGVLDFARTYTGTLVTETMLVEGINDTDANVAAVGDFLARLRPAVSYLAIPIRPPLEKQVRPPAETAVNRAYQLLTQKHNRVEYMIGYEGNAFACTGDVEQDLLSITAVHPMREEAVADFLKRAGAEWNAVRRLVGRGELIETDYEGRKFYLRKFKDNARSHTSGREVASGG